MKLRTFLTSAVAAAAALAFTAPAAIAQTAYKSEYRMSPMNDRRHAIKYTLRQIIAATHVPVHRLDLVCIIFRGLSPRQ